MTRPIVVTVGMRVRLRKLHPCGSDTWAITRTGADIGLACAGCGRRVMLEREEFERRVREVLQATAEERSLPVAGGSKPSAKAGA